MPVRRAAAIVAAIVALGLIVWYVASPVEEGAAVRERLQAFRDDVNRSTSDGLNPSVRANRFGGYFTEDAEIDLGRGAAPIRGRETIVRIAELVQPRTVTFSVKLEDITVLMAPGGDAADVRLTVELVQRSITTNERSLDAREFSMQMRRVGDEWQIARVAAVEVLK